MTIIVSPFNQPPVNTVPGPQIMNEDSSLTFNGSISVNDPDAAPNPLRVTLGVGSGQLTLSTTAGLTFTQGDGTGDAAMTFTGTQSAINAALNGLIYLPNSKFNGSVTLTITTNDLGNTGGGGPLADTDTVGITVNAVNDGPVNTVPGPQSANEDVVKTIPGVLVSDLDAAVLQVTLAVTSGTLTLVPGSLAFTTGDGTADALMTFTGSPAAINTALSTLSYLSASNSNGTDTLTITTSDLGNTGSGGTLTDSDSVAITIASVNDAPTFTVPTGTFPATDEDGARNQPSFATGITAGAANESGQLLTFQVTNNNNGLFSVQPFIDSSGNLTFTPKPNAHGTATVTVRLMDNGGTLNGGVDLSPPQTFTIDVSKPRPLHNFRDPIDVNDNQSTDLSLDALLIFNYLNNFGSQPVPPGIFGPNYLDVSGDNFISPIDALLIFNVLNNPPPPGGGGRGRRRRNGRGGTWPMSRRIRSSRTSNVSQQPQQAPAEHQSLADYIAALTADEEELARRRRGTY